MSKTEKKQAEPSGPSFKAQANTAGNVFAAFPTVYYAKAHSGPEIDKLNEELKRIAYQLEQEQKSDLTSSIVGGHHSDRKLFESGNWAVEELRKIIMADFASYIGNYWSQECIKPLNSFGLKEFKVHLNGWTMVIRDGDMSAPHLHPQANISGTYYVSVPPGCEGNDQRGFLVLCDPRIRAGVSPVLSQITSVRIPPKTGNIIMFPSYLEHYVLPFKGDGERISIAFNIYLPKELGGLAVDGKVDVIDKDY